MAGEAGDVGGTCHLHGGRDLPGVTPSACAVPAVPGQTPFCPFFLPCRILPPGLAKPPCPRGVPQGSRGLKAPALLEGRHGHRLSDSQTSAPSQIGLNPTTSWNDYLRKCILGGGSSSVLLTAAALLGTVV